MTTTDPMFRAAAPATPPPIPADQVNWHDHAQTAAQLFPTTKPPEVKVPLPPTEAEITARALFPTSAPTPPAAPAQQQQGQATQERAAFALDAPEGMDPSAVATFSTIVAQTGMDQAGAQKLLGALHGHMVEQRREQAAAWQQRLRDDPAVDMLDAQRVLSLFSDAELNAWLTATGGGNHPGLARMLSRIGRAIDRRR
jgi:hypothetical protein